MCTNKKTKSKEDVMFTQRLPQVHFYCEKKGSLPTRRPELIEFRSYKNFCEENFVKDLATAQLHVSEVFDDVNDCCWAFTKLQTDVMDEHAPFKKKKLRKLQVPFNSGRYRRAIYKKTQMKNCYKLQ
jgi:hypothetical protein